LCSLTNVSAYLVSSPAASAAASSIIDCSSSSSLLVLEIFEAVYLFIDAAFCSLSKAEFPLFLCIFYSYGFY
jgi:hypothetical protein